MAERTLQVLRGQPYEVLVERYLSEPEVAEMAGASGTEYQVEISAFWDSGKPGNLRVCARVDDGGWRAFKPLSVDFIIAPDGTFVGEAGDL